MHFSAPFIRRPVATFLLSLAVILAGAVAYTLLPVASLPQVEFPVISVGASLPGADPETMASSVATPLERQFSKIAGVNEMTSYSSTGTVGITLQFDLNARCEWGRAGCAGGDQCGAESAACEPAEQSWVLQGESGGLADHDYCADLGHDECATALRRLRQHSGAEDRADPWRGADLLRREREAVGADRGEPDAAGALRRGAGGSAGGDRHGEREPAEGISAG